MSDRFLVLQAKGSGPFGTPVLSLCKETDGIAGVVAYIEDSALASRIADLLNRNGLVDAPMPTLEESDEG